MSAVARTALRVFVALAIALITGIVPAPHGDRLAHAASQTASQTAAHAAAHAPAHTHATHAHTGTAAPACDHAPAEPCCHHANTCCVSLLCGASTAPVRTARTLQDLSAAAPRFSASVHRRPPRPH